MQFNDFIKASPKIRPLLNVGCLLDVPTGRPQLGKRGEMYINGGTPYVTGIVGIANTFKSVFGDYLNLTMLDRYASAITSKFDTETSASLARAIMLASRMDNIGGVDLAEEGRLFMSDSTVMDGDDWFQGIKKMADARQKERKTLLRTCPFQDDKGEDIQILSPFGAFIDSLSLFATSKLMESWEKNKLGESGANMDNMSAARHKASMLMQVPTLTGKSALFLIMTAHVGVKHQLDPYAAPDKKLAFLKGKSIKNTTENFTFLTNNLWYIYNSSVLANKGTKAPEYPRSPDDDMEGDTDLQVILVQNLRGKNGPSGLPFEIVLSQREGFLPALTEFHFIKNNDRWALTGNDRNYVIDMAPDISLQRTTVRSKIDENYRLRRALQVCSEMLQMKQIWEYPEYLEVVCTPAELYADLKAMGYNVDELLETTRGYWIFEEDHTKLEKPPLTTLDLMRMRKGLYVPYFFTAEQKAAIDMSKKIA